ncbi:aminoglycoside adenylyltransferase domain-containing protein [Deinococcus sonorensis]|uniref:Aminoglycoside adenylyltransferase domain-containing protein n=2 Tax=Deinococcus sonorensis TaxID=309891 RepID=A0AAU7UCJ3_9DEIO
MNRPAPPDVQQLVGRLAQELPQQLGESLMGLYLHGSLVTGDFNPQRSDIDLLAVLAQDPSEEDLEHLHRFHRELEAEEPAWRGRIEVNYSSLAGLRDFRTQPHLMARISPGEPLHLVQATRHYLLQWYMAWHSGVALFGPPPQDLLPSFDPAEFVAVVREHAGNWPVWITEMDPGQEGGHAYAVLTVCRALYTVTTGEQRSKKQAAVWAAQRLPAWAGLIDWAVEWWFDTGAARARPDCSTVQRFVMSISEQIAHLPE